MGGGVVGVSRWAKRVFYVPARSDALMIGTEILSPVKREHLVMRLVILPVALVALVLPDINDSQRFQDRRLTVRGGLLACEFFSFQYGQ